MMEQFILGAVILGAAIVVYRHIRRPSCGCKGSCSSKEGNCHCTGEMKDHGKIASCCNKE